MALARAQPFELGIGALADARFPGVRAELAGAGSNPRDRDAFVLLPAVVGLLRELRPEAGVGAGVETSSPFCTWRICSGTPGRPCGS